MISLDVEDNLLRKALKRLRWPLAIQNPLKVRQILIEGGQSTVRQAERSSRGLKQLVALKFFKSDTDGSFEREVEFLTTLKGSRRIIRLIDIPQEPIRSLVLELANHGDLVHLRNCFSDHGLDIPEQFLWHVLGQLVEGLAWMHEGVGSKKACKWRAVIHRDLKADNILLHKTSGVFPDIKIADFGLSVFAESPDSIEEFNGSPDWRCRDGMLSTKQADVWAIAAVIHYLALDQFVGEYCQPIEISIPSPTHTKDPGKCTCFQDLCRLPPKRRKFSEELNMWMWRVGHPNSAGRWTAEELMKGFGPAWRKERKNFHQHQLPPWASRGLTPQNE